MKFVHENTGNCRKCDQIFDTYIGFYLPLRSDFKAFQKINPEAHISCAGRGEAEQEACFTAKTSKAHFGESAHNWNAAIDIFELGGADIKNLWESKWFQEKVKPWIDSLPQYSWYGQPDAKFKELPHIEWKNWKTASLMGQLIRVDRPVNNGPEDAA